MSSDDTHPIAEQLRSIEAACAAYDAGDRAAAARLAASFRALFHPSAGSPAPVSRYLKLLSTCGKRPGPDRGGSWAPLIGWDLDLRESAFVCLPKLGAARPAHRFVTLDQWWEAEPIYQSHPLKF